MQAGTTNEHIFITQDRLTNDWKAWQSPSWWSHSAVLQTPIRGTFVATCEILLLWQGVGCGLVWMISLHCSTPKTLHLYKNLALISCTSRVVTNFMSKLSTFRYYGMQQKSIGGQLEWDHETNRPRKPQFGTRMWDMSPIAIANFVFK